MPEVVGTFSSTEAWQERANSSSEAGNRSFSGSAQECLEFAEGHLDGIEVGRVLGQVTKCRARVLDRLTDARTFVNADIVHHDDISVHKSPRIREAIENARATLRYLPQYSPDLNPIEMPLSKFKAFLRRAAERTIPGLRRAIRSFLPRLGARE